MPWHGTASSVTITSDLVYTTFAEVPVMEGASKLWLDFVLTSDTALTAFEVDVKVHKDSPRWFPVANASSDYTTNIQSPLVGVCNDPTSLVKGNQCAIEMDVRGLHRVRFMAKAGASDAVVSDWFYNQR